MVVNLRKEITETNETIEQASTPHHSIADFLYKMSCITAEKRSDYKYSYQLCIILFTAKKTRSLTSIFLVVNVAAMRARVIIVIRHLKYRPLSLTQKLKIKSNVTYSLGIESKSAKLVYILLRASYK